MSKLPWITWPPSGFNSSWRLEQILQREKKRIIVEAVTVISNSQMCSRHLPLLSLCQCCHRYKGKQRKGMSVIQKPIPYVLFKQISRWGQKHSNAKQSRKNLMTLIPIWSANVTAAGSHTPAMSPTGALMGSILHGANSDPNPPLEDLSHRLLQNTENAYCDQRSMDFQILVQLCALSTLFSCQKFWNMHWFPGSTRLVFCFLFFWFATSTGQRGWRDSKIWKWFLASVSDVVGKCISDSIRICSQEQLWAWASRTCHMSTPSQLLTLTDSFKAGGTSDGWMQCVVGYFRIHLLCVI